MSTIEIQINSDIVPLLFGRLDANIALIERELGVKCHPTAVGISIFGERAQTAQRAIEALIDIIKGGLELDARVVRQALLTADEQGGERLADMLKSVVATTPRGKIIRPRSVGQHLYVDAIKHNTVTFGIGPAGSGKTYLAVALAVSAFRQNHVDRIVLTRPAIEAGEKLGFLPGDLISKVDPYLRPLYDALNEMFGTDNYLRLIERGIIEVAPLAFMRGRTLSHAFIIMDEAQNTTDEQMKMFLTRFGEGSKVVVNGDLTQIDLPNGRTSGLSTAAHLLEGIEDIAVCRLGSQDIVRHDLVAKIVDAYQTKGGK